MADILRQNLKIRFDAKDAEEGYDAQNIGRTLIALDEVSKVTSGEISQIHNEHSIYKSRVNSITKCCLEIELQFVRNIDNVPTPGGSALQQLPYVIKDLLDIGEFRLVNGEYDVVGFGLQSKLTAKGKELFVGNDADKIYSENKKVAQLVNSIIKEFKSDYNMKSVEYFVDQDIPTKIDIQEIRELSFTTVQKKLQKDVSKRVTLEVCRPVLKGKGKWGFMLVNTDQATKEELEIFGEISAILRDSDYAKMVADSEATFKRGSIITVDLLFSKGYNINNRLVKQYMIMKVYNG